MSEEDNFVNAFRYAVAQGNIIIGPSNFQGWQDNCSCASCRSQRIIFDFIVSIQKTSAQQANGADAEPGKVANLEESTN